MVTPTLQRQGDDCEGRQNESDTRDQRLLSERLVPLRLRPGHRELVAAAYEAITPEVEPERCEDIEAHHGDQLRAVSQEHRKVGSSAENEKQQGRQWMQRMHI